MFTLIVIYLCGAAGALVITPILTYRSLTAPRHSPRLEPVDHIGVIIASLASAVFWPVAIAAVLIVMLIIRLADAAALDSRTP